MLATLIAMSLGAVFTDVKITESAGEHLLYDRPADDSDDGWEKRSLPVGCGHFGANVFGIVTNDRIQVTHNAVLTYRDHPSGEAGNLTNALEIRLKTDHGDWTSYRRGLDLDTATAWTEYAAGGGRFRREVFASYPARLLVMRLTADRPKTLCFELSAAAPFCRPFGRDGRRAKTSVGVDTIDIDQSFETFAILLASRLKVVTDGRVASKGVWLAVADATEATVYFSCDTNYELKPERFRVTNNGRIVCERTPLSQRDPRPRVERAVEHAVEKGFAAVRAEQLRDYRGLFGRVSVDLGGDPADAEVTTDRLMDRYRKGNYSRYLEETYLQFGRYLLISSSRPGTLPANLQGVWTCYDESPWGSGYWHNINVQMNYWPAFSGNLAECFRAYADFNAAFRPRTKELARNFVREYAPENLPSKGEPEPDWWCVGTAVYPYLVVNGPGVHSGPGTGGLITKCFTDWWEFTRDEQALREHVWPVVHGMADFLTRCVRDYGGKCLSVFSASPEQVCANKDWSWSTGVPYYHTIGCAFDQQMIWENNNDLVRMAEALGTNDAVVVRCREQLDRYDPVTIGASGQIKEFREEKFYGEIGEKKHRHISQLCGLMPGTLITHNTPEWMAAAKKTLDLRGDKIGGGWSMAHRLNAWARAGDGDRAYLLLNHLLSIRTYDNLWDAVPFQIDGNFGGTAGMIEMLIQSHAGYIELLPALPKAWAKKGSFRGLCARGAFEVDCEWADGKPTKVSVRSLKGLKSDIRFKGRKLEVR